MKTQTARFYRHFSHDLRNALGRADVVTDMLEEDDPESRALALGILKRSLKQAQRLAEQYSILKRLEVGDDTADEVHIHLIWQQGVDSLTYQRADVTVQANIAPVTHTLPELAAQQITSQLCDNLACYTPEGGVIHLSVGTDGCTELTAPAAGLSAEDLIRIGNPFERGVAHTEHTEGAGLGLCIVQLAAKACGYGFGMELTGDEKTLRLTLKQKKAD